MTDLTLNELNTVDLEDQDLDVSDIDLQDTEVSLDGLDTEVEEVSTDIDLSEEDVNLSDIDLGDVDEDEDEQEEVATTALFPSTKTTTKAPKSTKTTAKSSGANRSLFGRVAEPKAPRTIQPHKQFPREMMFDILTDRITTLWTTKYPKDFPEGTVIPKAFIKSTCEEMETVINEILHMHPLRVLGFNITHKVIQGRDNPNPHGADFVKYSPAHIRLHLKNAIVSEHKAIKGQKVDGKFVADTKEDAAFIERVESYALGVKQARIDAIPDAVRNNTAAKKA